MCLQCLMVPWDDRVPKFSYTPGGEASSLFVPTVETTRLSYFLDSLVANRCVCMLLQRCCML
jgi:dynein heavy chain